MEGIQVTANARLAERLPVPNKRPLEFNENEALHLLHALRFYMDAKGGKMGIKLQRLEYRLDDYLNGPGPEMREINVTHSSPVIDADIKTYRSAELGSVISSHRMNLFIRFNRTVWLAPDRMLLKEMCQTLGTNSWLPIQLGDETQGPYVRMFIPQKSSHLERLISESTNVLTWGEKPLYYVCENHHKTQAWQIQDFETFNASCSFCGKLAAWMY